MTNRVIIVHGWGGSPETDFLPWAREELQKKGYEVITPVMPEKDYPKIEKWIPYLAKVIGEVRETDNLIGHSIGCQTILRYLSKLPEDKKVDRVIFVAGFTSLMGLEPEDIKIRDVWLNTPLDFGKVKAHVNKFIAIFSDNDPYVSLEENRKIFEEKLGAEILIEHHKGHFNDMPQERPDLLKLF